MASTGLRGIIPRLDPLVGVAHAGYCVDEWSATTNQTSDNNS